VVVEGTRRWLVQGGTFKQLPAAYHHACADIAIGQAAPAACAPRNLLAACHGGIKAAGLH
jgi:hypothetical protein